MRGGPHSLSVFPNLLTIRVVVTGFTGKLTAGPMTVQQAVVAKRKTPLFRPVRPDKVRSRGPLNAPAAENPTTIHLSFT